jgi:hypothetical protein
MRKKLMSYYIIIFLTINNMIDAISDQLFSEIIDTNRDKDESDLPEITRDKIIEMTEYLNNISIYSFADDYFNREISVERVHPTTSRLLQHYFLSSDARKKQIVQYHNLGIHYIMFDYHQLCDNLDSLLQNDCEFLNGRTVEIYLDAFLEYADIKTHLNNLMRIIEKGCAIYVNMPDRDNELCYYLTDNEKYMKIIKFALDNTGSDNSIKLRVMLLTISYELDIMRMNERLIAM